MSLSTLLNRIRPSAGARPRALGPYGLHLQRLAAYVRDTSLAWDRLRQVELDSVRLANTAAVNRWELLRQVGQFERFDVPPGVASLHREVGLILGDVARAWQLLANGYRACKAEAVCDGQALLVDSVAAIERIRRRLELQPSAVSSQPAGPSDVLDG